MLQWLYTYVSNICFECFSCFIRILQVFLSECCICYGGYTHMLQAYVSNVSPVLDICCNKCFMLQVFSLAGTGSGCMQSVLSGCCICCNCYTHMFASVCFNCFKRMLQVFYLDVTYVVVAIHICCKRMFHMFQRYVAASASCCKWFS
jgi:hypothetical protein